MTAAKTKKALEVHGHVLVKPRPPAHTAEREQYDRAARTLWRIVVVLLAVTLALIIRDYTNSVLVVVVCDRIPDAMQDAVEFIADL